MKQGKKRTISLLIVFVILMSMMSAMSVSAAEELCLQFAFDNTDDMELIAPQTNAVTKIDSAEGMNGTSSVKTSAKKSSTGELSAFYLSGIEWYRDETYTVSFMAKAKTLKEAGIGLVLKTNFYYKNESNTSKKHSYTFNTISSEWTEYSYTFTIKDFMKSTSSSSSMGVESLENELVFSLYKPDAGDSVWIDNVKITKTIVPREPVVKSAEIKGTAQVGRSLQANAVVFDRNPQDQVEATYQWQVKNGNDWDDITGATAQSYTIPKTMLGEVIRVLVTPVSNNAPLTGTPFPSEPTNPITEYSDSPSGKIPEIKGDFLVGKTLSASYTYLPSESNIGQGESLYIWETSRDNKTFTPVQSSVNTDYTVGIADFGMWLRVRVIPKDLYGLPGEELVSDAIKYEGEPAFYVSENGDNNNPGTLDAPFKTIEKARDTIRQIPVLPKGGITVNIMGGTYPVSSTIAFKAEDSGTEDAPIVYQAYNGEKVTYIGGTVLDSSKIQKVTDKDLLNNLIEEDAKDHLYMLDLGEQGVKMDALAKSSSYFFPKRIYMNNHLLTEARWPNDDQSQNVIACRPLTNADDGIDESKINYKNTIIMYEYPDPENRSAKWNIKKGDAYIGGAVVFFWATCQLRIDNVDSKNKIVTSLDTNNYSAVKDVMWGPQYKVYFSNIFAEIDKPGESYVDREKNILYFYPVGGVENAEMVISTRKSQLMTVTGASYVTFKGIDFKNTVSTPVTLSNCDHVVVEDAEVANTTAGGISMTNCTDTVITGCNFYTIGTSAISISGGDRVNLTPSGNEIKNNNFHNIVLNPASRNTAVDIQDACGEWVHHNEFDDMNLYVIRMMNCNDILIEYNKFSNAGKLNIDAGIINWGREFDSVGHTVRYNYFENIGSKLLSNYFNAHQSVSIFTDDASTGGNIYGNIFLNGGSDQGGTGSATVGNGPEFSNIWGNISICTDFDKMTNSFMMKSWGNTQSMKNLYGVNLSSGTTISSWLYQMQMRDAFGGDNANWFQADDLSLMWTDTWIDHYKNTQWAAALQHYGYANYTEAKAFYDAGDYAGLLKFLSNRLTTERTNKIHDNVSLGATKMTSLAEHYNNYNGTQGAITQQDKELFVDFDNKDFTLAPGALEKIQKQAPGFEKLPDFNQIGLTSAVGGHKPVVTFDSRPIIGVAASGNTITASYNFTDADGDLEGQSEIYWYVSDSANGKFEQIYGIEDKDFEVTNEYAGRYLKYEVVPYDMTLLRGEVVMSAPISVREGGTVSITKLSNLIQEATDLLYHAAIGEDEELYPQSAADALAAAIEQAYQVAENESASRTQIAQAEQRLSTAMNTFKDSKNEFLKGVEIERVSVNPLLRAQEDWKFAGENVQREFTKDGSLVFGGEEAVLASFTGKTYHNAEFSFTFKAETIDPTAANAKDAWVGVYFRQNDTDGMIGSNNRNAFMLDMKQDKIQLQEWSTPGGVYQNTILTDHKIEMGKEYEVTVGLYDMPDSKELVFRFVLDGKTLYSRKFADNGLYGTDGYFAISSGANTKVTLSPFYADTTALTEGITELQQLIQCATSGITYTQDTMNSVTAVAEQAQQVADNEDAVQWEVDDALAEVETALNTVKTEFHGVFASNEKQTITVMPYGAEKGCRIIVSLYYKDAYVGAKTVVYNGEMVSIPIEEEFDSAKVYVWDSFKSMSPLFPVTDVK